MADLSLLAPSWALDLDEIRLEGLEVECVVGIYPREKLNPQPLELGVSLFLDTREAVRTNSLTRSVDYAALSAELTFILQNARFKLLETAAEALCHYILSPPVGLVERAPVIGVTVLLKKPKAFGGAMVPSLKITRHRQEVRAYWDSSAQGRLYMIHESLDSRLFRLHVPAYGETPAFTHDAGVAAEMPGAMGLFLDEEPLKPGMALNFAEGSVRSYRNPTGHDVSLLCIAEHGAKFCLADRGFNSRAIERTHLAPVDTQDQYF